MKNFDQKPARVTVKKMETDAEIRGKAYVHWKAWHEAYPGLVSQDYLDRFTLEKAEKMAFSWTDSLLVALDGDRVIGFAGYGTRTEDPGFGEVFALYVLSEYYGTGVGLLLMDAAMEQLKAYPEVRLWVLKDNARAIRFYEKCGFTPDGQELYSERVSASEIRMCRKSSAGQALPEELELYVPKREDLWFQEKLLSDPATMSYNAPWFPPDGCILFPESDWDEWMRDWIGNEPECFYAYLRRKEDGAFVGDVNFHRSGDGDWWDMGIVLYAPYRGKGYAAQGLRLLLDRAFRVDAIPCLHNDFETGRTAAYRAHRAAGFRCAGIDDGCWQLRLTREEYLHQ